MMSNVAVITARGGSKRIPRKNIRDFCGKPIMAYSIEAAKESALFDEVMVSTDDEEIAEVARRYGAAVPFMRSAKTADDYATTTDVLQEVLREYKKRGRLFDVLCCIYPTAPFVTSKKLQDSFAYMQDRQADAVVPVVKFTYPPQRCFVVKNGLLQFKWPENIRARSQDLEPFYHDAGQYYFWRIEKFSEEMTDNTVPFVLNDLEVQDIDNIEDWELAELKYRILHSKR